MHPDLAKYIPVAKAIEALLHPYAEIVLHDLATQKIAAIFNNYSRRNAGEDSLLEKELHAKKLPDYFEPYEKTNWNGKKIKSTTATIRDAKGKPVGLFCINLDISKLEELQLMLSTFMGGGQQLLPKELFSDDWKEKINLFVHGYLKKQGKTLATMTKEDKRLLVLKLFEEGAFRAKHAAAYVGNVLDISRATVYKYLSNLSK